MWRHIFCYLIPFLICLTYLHRSDLFLLQGRFEIISLSGSFLLSDNNGNRSRSGGLSVSLAGSDGRVLGGLVAGMLMAASPVQVWVNSCFHLCNICTSVSFWTCWLQWHEWNFCNVNCCFLFLTGDCGQFYCGWKKVKLKFFEIWAFFSTDAPYVKLRRTYDHI